MSKELEGLSQLKKVNIEEELKGAYLDYAMSVIVSRALPDVRDGLKPVHRRALYAMYNLSNTYNKAYKKSARVVGEVIGKYHPHGDTPVYETIVRMAQHFSLRYPLVDGQGNFGSIDGDSAAAMRYTEIRMQKITEHLLSDIESETVDFIANYDGSLKEPVVLPARLPHLLINGSSGIAVGMATNIPPHNLAEVIDGLIFLIDTPMAESEDLLKFIKGPDFPTGGYIFASQGIRDAYLQGRGSVTVRAKTEIESLKNEKNRIIVSELPYQVNKSKLLEKIADLVKEKKIEGISDLADESDLSGIRVVIDLKKGEDPNVILNQLYKLTALQENYSINLLAIYQKQPKTFSLKEILWSFIEHRKEVITRRTKFELNKAESKAHVLLGFKKVIKQIDLLVETIKKAASTAEAAQRLVEVFSLSTRQAEAILDLRLARLTQLEQDKIHEEYQQTLRKIEELQRLLANEQELFGVMKQELLEIRAEHADKRRSEIIFEKLEAFQAEDLIADTETLVSMTHAGYIKRASPDLFKNQVRGGKGVRATASSVDEDFILAMYRCTTLSRLLCFTDRGKVYALKVHEIPEAGRTARGKAIINLLNLAGNEKVRAMIPIKSFEENLFILLVRKSGIIKRMELTEFKNIRSNSMIAIGAGEENDLLVDAKLSNGKQDVFLCSKLGMSIRFSESEIRATGRSSRGVTGMNLSDDDEIVSMEVVQSNNEGNQESFEILTVTEMGIGKRTQLSEYRCQSRGGVGIINIKPKESNTFVLGSRQVTPQNDIVLVSSTGNMIRLSAANISSQSRNTQGVKLISLAASEKLVAFEVLLDEASAR